VIESDVAGLVSGTHTPGSMTPVEIIERQRRRRVRDLEESFAQHFQRLAKKLAQEDSERDIALYRRGVRNQKYYEGDHYGYFNPLSRRWHSKPIERNDPFYPVNKFRYYSDGITTQHTGSRTNLVYIPSSDDDRTISGSRFARRVGSYYQDKILTESFLQEEGKNGQFFGTEYRLSYWNPSKGPLIERPVYQAREQQEEDDSYLCASCRAFGSVEDLALASDFSDPGIEPKCPRCGSTALELIETEPFDLPEISEYERVPAGDADTEVVPALQVKYDRSGGLFRRGQHVRRQRRIRYQIIEEVFDWYEYLGSKSGDAAPDEAGLAAMDVLESSIGAASYAQRHGSTEAERVIIEQWWFRPSLYGRYRVPADVELANGDRIPRGTEIREVYPSGMYMLTVDGEPIDFRDEDFRKHWQQTRFILVPNRADGDGIEDMVRPQQEYNEARSIRVAHVKFNATPPTIIRDPIREGDYDGSPKKVVHVSGLSLEHDLSKLIHQPPERRLDAHVFGLAEQCDSEMQATSKALPSSLGMADQNETGGQRTASGLKLMSNNATNLRSPELGLRAEGNVEWIEQILNLFKENAIYERYIPFQGRAGERQGAYFKGSDIDADFQIVAKKGSWLPKTKEERQTNLFNALTIGNGLVLMPQAPAEWRQKILDEFDIDIELDDFALDARLARARIEEMERLLPSVVQMVQTQVMPALQQKALEQQTQLDQAKSLLNPMDPNSAAMLAQMPEQVQMPDITQVAAQMLSQMVEIMPEADEHPVHILFIKNWLKSDEGLEANEVLKQAALTKLREHKQAMVGLAAEQQMQALQAQAPMMQAAAAEQSAQADQQQQRERDGKKMDAQIQSSALREQTASKILTG